jgi:hypothetical protein
VQLLQHFDEHFDRGDCGGQCDNCRNTAPASTRNVTGEAQAILRIVRKLSEKENKCRAGTISEVFRGSKGKAAAEFVESVAQLLHHRLCARQQCFLHAHPLISLCVSFVPVCVSVFPTTVPARA